MRVVYQNEHDIRARAFIKENTVTLTNVPLQRDTILHIHQCLLKYAFVVGSHL